MSHYKSDLEIVEDHLEYIIDAMMALGGWSSYHALARQLDELGYIRAADAVRSVS